MLRLRRHAACSRSPERSVVVLLCHGRLCWLRCVLCRYDVRVLLTALCFQNRMAFKSRQTLRPPSLLTLIQAVSQQEQQQQQLTHTLTHSHTHTLTHSLTHSPHHRNADASPQAAALRSARTAVTSARRRQTLEVEVVRRKGAPFGFSIAGGADSSLPNNNSSSNNGNSNNNGNGVFVAAMRDDSTAAVCACLCVCVCVRACVCVCVCV